MRPTGQTSGTGRHSPSQPGAGHRPDRGAVLLEVILALTLFVFAAGIISSSLQTAVSRTLRLHDQTHALDLAASVIAEIEMGARPAQAAGPEHFEAPFEAWTWQIEAAAASFGPGDSAPLQRVTVIVRNDAGTTTQRLSELVSGEVLPAVGADPSNSAALGGKAPEVAAP